MRNTATIVILSVVATTLVLGIVACITIKPFTAIGLAPILAAISLIIRAIRGRTTNPHGPAKQPPKAPASRPGQPCQGPQRPTQHSNPTPTPSPTTSDQETAAQDLTTLAQPISSLSPIAPRDETIVRPVVDPFVAGGNEPIITLRINSSFPCQWPSQLRTDRSSHEDRSEQ